MFFKTKQKKISLRTKTHDQCKRLNYFPALLGCNEMLQNSILVLTCLTGPMNNKFTQCLQIDTKGMGFFVK